MIIGSRYNDRSKLQYAVMRGNKRLWLPRSHIPEEEIEKYRKYIADGKGKRGMMMIVADIEEETAKLQKRKQSSMKPLPRPEVSIQETTSPKRNNQVVKKKKQVLKIQENKKVQYYARKKIEKTKRLEILREKYSSRIVDSLKEPIN